MWALSLPLQGRWHAERDGEVVTNLRQPLSQPAADSSPERGAFARCGGRPSQSAALTALPEGEPRVVRRELTKCGGFGKIDMVRRTPGRQHSDGRFDLGILRREVFLCRSL